MRQQRSRLKQFFTLFTAALLTFPHPTRSQGTLAYQVDTLTTGNSEERNPSTQHNALFGPPTQWLVFEHTAEGMTSISGMKLDNQVPAWKPEIVQISGLHPAGLVRNPDVAGTMTSSMPLRVVAWEQLSSNRWNIYYSTRSDSDIAWSEPRPLTEDTVDNTSIQLRPLDGEHILATWRRGKDLVGSRIGHDGRVDTILIGTSTVEDFDFDVITAIYGGSAGLWVTQDSLGKQVYAYRTIGFDYSGSSNFGPIKYLSFSFPVGHPWLVIVDPQAWPMVVFQGQINNRNQVFIWYGSTLASISADESADYGNPAGLFNPMITSSHRTEALRRETFWINGVLVVERKGPTDSSLVIWPGNYFSADTLRSSGTNRNCVVGSPWIPLGPWVWVPVVWESNRTGQWHLYGTFARLSLGGLTDDGPAPVGFSLAQNYPNPFNPTTALSYELLAASDVRLTVFDVLGREVAVLVNERKPAGSHTVQFDGSGLATGVYLYDLMAGSFVQTKKMILLK
jgi:hypothetical protein